MDENTSRLADLLKDKRLQFPDPMIAALLRDAREEAFAEAKAILKESMVQAMLERAIGELENPEAAAALGETMSSSSPVVRPKPEATRDNEQIREIEALRRKIAENDRLLSEMRKPAASSEKKSPQPSGKEAAPVGQSGGDGHGYYVYGIVPGDSGQPLDGLPNKGIDPAYPTYALPYQAIQAVVSKVSLQEFGQEQLEAKLSDNQWLEAKVRAHEAILESVMVGHTLIPMRFCTIYQSESRVQEALAQHYQDFISNLTRLDGKQEWAVKVYCDGEVLTQKVEEVSDRVKELKAKAAQESSGVAYFLKKKTAQAMAEEMERICDEIAQHSHDRLAGHAEETRVNSLQSKEMTGRKEEMLLNGAYLVAEGQMAAFRAELASLEKEYGAFGFGYELSGPWPLYNFVTIGFEETAADE